jgi:uncharacterized protein involved in response to NO
VRQQPIPILRLAFRPFFLFGALFSVLAIGWWTWWWLNPSVWTPYGGAVWWHGHEMIFGFAAAIVVGFLLTAVQNWTGVPGLRGLPLGLLFGLWLAGRLLISFGGAIAAEVIIIVDSSFLLVAAMAMAYPVITAKRWRNLMFVPILLVLCGLNLTSHLALQSNPLLAMKALQTAVLLISLIIGIVGGRVMPMFTTNGLMTAGIKITKPEPKRWLELSSLLSLLLVVISSLIGFDQLPNAFNISLLAFTAITNSFRFLRWGFWRCWSVPLLWSLHLAYMFLPLGLIALLLVEIGLLENISAALHCFTVGTIGGMILSMISRVSLGHTGRPLIAPKPMVLAFILLLLGTALRVILPGWFSAYSAVGIGLAGILWVTAFAIFCGCYAKVLISPKPDGTAG